ncbi:nucleotidyltransferase domain-containing protein [Paenibacillus sp. OV219]|uniref:nucleotidyltransferase domain-containing protein n=1 Tax=Paenibacillus sp. OV219 TaxID=1884377 RepID=UPI0008D1328D|nr:nucleotidyltransferase domain-containing protein [Paenibacillus sp. OV219]SEN36350.1 protein of unknown function [Paenibacillus sp. OV219]
MLPPSVERKMSKLASALRSRTSIVKSIYLYGSVALDDYIDGTSDIDFVAIVRENLTEVDIKAISEAHAETEQECPEVDIMGMYLLTHDLGQSYRSDRPCVTFYNKEVHTNGFGADWNPITWWILKHRGIRIDGAEQLMDYEVDTQSLVNYVIENMNNYWLGWIERLEQFIASKGSFSTRQLDEAVDWCALGMLRQLYTLSEHGIKSKVQSGQYGFTVIPEKWHGIIQEAIWIKQLHPERVYTDNDKRLGDLAALLRYIHEEANRICSSLS